MKRLVSRGTFLEVPLEDTKRRSKDFLFDEVGHISFYSPRTIRWLLQSSNLHVLSQITVNPGKGVYMFQKGRKGLLKYYIQQALLDVLPEMATKMFTYHTA